MFSSFILAGKPKVPLFYTASASNVDLFADAGSPSFPVDLYVEISSGVAITRITSAGFAQGSTCILLNDGHILGVGGDGGRGEGWEYDSEIPISLPVMGSAGEAGGSALDLGLTLFLDTSSGYIWGGGGGEGGWGYSGTAPSGAPGRGGGGGVSSGLGGVGGIETVNGSSNQARDGADAGEGIAAQPGDGGGSWGASGNTGSNGGYSGGAGGRSIRLNGHSLYFIVGDLSTYQGNGQIKGGVS